MYIVYQEHKYFGRDCNGLYERKEIVNRDVLGGLFACHGSSDGRTGAI